MPCLASIDDVVGHIALPRKALLVSPLAFDCITLMQGILLVLFLRSARELFDVLPVVCFDAVHAELVSRGRLAVTWVCTISHSNKSLSRPLIKPDTDVSNPSFLGLHNGKALLLLLLVARLAAVIVRLPIVQWHLFKQVLCLKGGKLSDLIGRSSDYMHARPGGQRIKR